MVLLACKKMWKSFRVINVSHIRSMMNSSIVECLKTCTFASSGVQKGDIPEDRVYLCQIESESLHFARTNREEESSCKN